ncbi:unnamed protein product [Paramecium sonneborni]|uniref:Uncharacterized protein n=1 Tax=Paramecium sonneborni TaxID=65129 RepID=A0A8S1PZB7_9CILI|nr:unnamed protein product [Paramecium sonneborni]
MKKAQRLVNGSIQILKRRKRQVKIIMIIEQNTEEK